MDSKMEELLDTSSNIQSNEPRYQVPAFLRRKVVLGVLVLFLVFSVALACTIAAIMVAILHHKDSGKTGDTFKFLHLSDFHYDPFYSNEASHKCFCNFIPGHNCSITGETHKNRFGRRRCDSPELLINATLQAAKKKIPDPAFVLITGDYVRHHTEMMGLLGVDASTEVLKIVARVMELVEENFPQAQAHHSFEPFGHHGHHGQPPTLASAIIGNNDLRKDYYLNISRTSASSPDAPNKWLLDLQPRIGNHLSSDERATFVRGGYFRRQIMPGLHLISLNTIIYSYAHTPSSTMEPDPLGQLQWLNETLTAIAAQGDKVYIAGHIPPTRDSWVSIRCWNQQYVYAYAKIVLHPGVVSAIAAQMFGHTHTDAYRVLRAKDFGYPGSSAILPVLISSAVTPIFQNNPSFRVVEVDSVSLQPVHYVSSSTSLPSTPESAQVASAPEFRESFSSATPTTVIDGQTHPGYTLDAKSLLTRAKAIEAAVAVLNQQSHPLGNKDMATTHPRMLRRSTDGDVSAWEICCRTTWQLSACTTEAGLPPRGLTAEFRAKTACAIDSTHSFNQGTFDACVASLTNGLLPGTASEL